MKKQLIVLILTSALALAATAAEGEHKAEDAQTKKKPASSAEQKALKKELLDKYDTNKNKRLDQGERSKMTPEDAKKWETVSPTTKGKPADADRKGEKNQ